MLTREISQNLIGTTLWGQTSEFVFKLNVFKLNVIAYHFSFVFLSNYLQQPPWQRTHPFHQAPSLRNWDSAFSHNLHNFVHLPFWLSRQDQLGQSNWCKENHSIKKKYNKSAISGFAWRYRNCWGAQESKTPRFFVFSHLYLTEKKYTAKKPRAKQK